MDSDAIFLCEVTKDNEVAVAGAKYKGNTHTIPDYDTTMYLDVTNIDKNDKSTWMTIYEAID